MKPSLPLSLFLPVSLFVFMAWIPAYPDTHYVSRTGSDTPPYDSWETASLSIQAAIDVASEGDTVLIGPGIFSQKILLNTGLTLSGSGRDSTIVGFVHSSTVGTHDLKAGRSADGTSVPLAQEPLLTCVRERGVLVEHLTVTGGSGSLRGTGIYISDSLGIVVRDCTVSECDADYEGAGIHISDSSDIAVRDCTISECRVDYEKAGGLGGGIYAVRSEVAIENCTLDRNWAREEGGGIFLATSDTRCRIVACEIIGNRSHEGSGGGMYSYGPCDILGCVIANNSAGGDGGGIFGSGPISIRRCVIANNEADVNPYSPHEGGAIYHRGDSRGDILNCVIAANRAGVWPTDGIVWESNVNVVNCTIVCHCFQKGSGGVYVPYPAETYGTYENVSNCIFGGNPLDVYGCRATYSRMGSRFYTEGEGNIQQQPKFRAYATCEVEEIGQYDYDDATTVLLCKETLGPQDRFRHMFAKAGDLRTVYLIAGNTRRELRVYGQVPQDLAARALEITDFTLAEDSPCIDAGNNEAEYLPDEDKAGNFRIYRGKSEWRVDMGAYEYGSRRFEVSAIEPTAEPGHLAITWNTQPFLAKTYSICFSIDLLSWTLAGSNIPSAGESTTWVDPYAGFFPQRFYKISSP
jgi:parallel beta-helix repeat protein